MEDKKKNLWGLAASRMLNPDRYRGRGRPRSEDYRVIRPKFTYHLPLREQGEQLKDKNPKGYIASYGKDN